MIFIREKRTEGNMFTKRDTDEKYEAGVRFFRELIGWIAPEDNAAEA